MGTTLGTTAQLSTTLPKFGTASLLCDGNSDYASVPSSTDFDFGNGPFTIDFYVKFNSLAAINSICGQSLGGGNVAKWCIIKDMDDSFSYASNYITFFYYDGSNNIFVRWGWTASIDTWYQVAINRSGDNWYLMINGVPTGGTLTQSASIPSVSSDFRIGSDGESWNWLNGRIDEYRVSNGIARWTSEFVPQQYEYDYASSSSCSSSSSCRSSSSSSSSMSPRIIIPV